VTDKPLKDKHFTDKIYNPVTEDNPLREEALHVYGVDFLDTKAILHHFRLYNPKRIEWINDSSCNVVLDEGNDVSNAIKMLSISKKYDDEWRESFPIKKDGISFSLFMRPATKNDVKNQTTTGKDS